MAIRNETERRRAKEQVEYLQSELEKIPASEREDEVTTSVINGLRMHISDIENELAEYDRLKKGLESVITVNSFDDVGELVIKARIARGWSQADLAEALGMKQQQVQRYESNDWEKISLWRLQEVVEALNLDVTIQAQLRAHTPAQGIELTQGGFSHESLLHHGAIFTTAQGTIAPLETPYSTSISQVAYGHPPMLQGVGYVAPLTVTTPISGHEVPLSTKELLAKGVKLLAEGALKVSSAQEDPWSQPPEGARKAPELVA